MSPLCRNDEPIPPAAPPATSTPAHDLDVRTDHRTEHALPTDHALPTVPAWRTHLLAAGLAVVTVALAARLVQLQWCEHANFAGRAQRMQIWEEPVPAQPGEIVDRQGRVLAATTPAVSLCLDPMRVVDPDDLAARLAGPLQLDPETLASRIREAGHRRFLWIKRRLSDVEVERVRALRLPAELIGLRTEFRRHYPQGTIAAHLLGLRDIDNRGRGGLEEAYDARLAGTAGRRRLRRDARGFVVELLDDESLPPRHGERIVTTLDSLLQIRVERRLDAAMQEWSPRSCTAIVMDARTAEILALASRPAFDPNHPEWATPESWSNRALSAVFEPGSTFKPFIAAWAVDRGLLQPDEMLDCAGGVYRMGPRVLHDHHPYGRLSVTDVLVKSSNIGMARIGERLTNSGLQQACAAFGFGRPTGLGLPGELPGLVRPPEQWDGYSTGSIPMGHEIAVTPMQLITAHRALAGGGRLLPPRLLRSGTVTDPGTSLQNRSSPPSIALDLPVVSPETAAWLVTGPMREVVTRGTGKAARLDGWTVFGKTGTAQVVDGRTGGYSHQRHICSFVGGAPAEDPQVMVLVLVEEPQGPGAMTGGVVAAPIVRDLLQMVLGPPPSGTVAAPPGEAAAPQRRQ